MVAFVLYSPHLIVVETSLPSSGEAFDGPLSSIHFDADPLALYSFQCSVWLRWKACYDVLESVAALILLENSSLDAGGELEESPLMTLILILTGPA